MGVNELQKQRITEKIKSYFGDDLQGKKIAIWGIAFKPNTDDIREAPALTIIRQLLEMNAEVSAFDPEAMENAKGEFEGLITFGNDQYDVLDQADALCILTEWSVFRTPDFDQMKKLMKMPIVFDGRNLYDLEPMREVGFYYNSIGREIVA
jgi:UDPglucose 6-dehydrogenase